MIYANEWEPYPAAWLRNLAAAGEIPPCDVDERSIADVRADELRGFSQWHMFAGIGGWPIALRLAGWPDDREIFTASCPCQPFSKAGRGAGFGDERDLWPCTHAIIRDLRPEVCMGEQVDGPAGNVWLDRTRTDMENIGYAFGAAILPACGVNAPIRRYRWFWVAARAGSVGFQTIQRLGSAAESVERDNGKLSVMAENGWGDRIFLHDAWNADRGMCMSLDRRIGYRPVLSTYARYITQSGLCGLVDGIRCKSPGVRAARNERIKGYGNAIVPQVAAVAIRAFMEARKSR